MKSLEHEFQESLQLVAKSQFWSEMPGRLLKLLESGLLQCRSHLEPEGATVIWFGSERLSLGEASAGIQNDSEKALMQLIEIEEVAFRVGYKDGNPTIWCIALKAVRENVDAQSSARESKTAASTPDIAACLTAREQGRLDQCLASTELALVREALHNSEYIVDDFTTEELCVLAGGLRNGYMIMPANCTESLLDVYFGWRERRNSLSVVLFPTPDGTYHLAVFTPGDVVRSDVWDTAQAVGLRDVTAGATTGSIMAEVDPSEAIRAAEALASFGQQPAGVFVQ